MQTELRQLLAVRERDYKTHLSSAGAPLACACDIEARIRLHFVLPDASGEPRFRELARMLVTYVTLYCFDALKRKDLDEQARNALFVEARDLFRKAARSGQAGEILIYFLLEAVMQAPQALRKMPLTTNPGEERKGSDGLHFAWNPELQILELYFAESKIWSDFGRAVEAAFDSVKTFHERGLKQHELNLFASQFKLIDPELQTRILSYIEGENVAKTRVNHACLIGFDWDEYKCLDDSRRKQFILEFEKRYVEWAATARHKIETRLSTFPFRFAGFEFFLLPFKEVEAFRRSFEEALRG